MTTAKRVTAVEVATDEVNVLTAAKEVSAASVHVNQWDQLRRIHVFTWELATKTESARSTSRRSLMEVASEAKELNISAPAATTPSLISMTSMHKTR